MSGPPPPYKKLTAISYSNQQPYNPQYNNFQGPGQTQPQYQQQPQPPYQQGQPINTFQPQPGYQQPYTRQPRRESVTDEKCCSWHVAWLCCVACLQCQQLIKS